MITQIKIESFKSFEKAEVSLGQVNVFVGANGSGKSNFLEAIGVLSAAAEGKVNDQMLLQHGVRPGVPKLYKSAFPVVSSSSHRAISPHISFTAKSESAEYTVTLNNPLTDPSPSWRYKHEKLQREGELKAFVGRSPATREYPNKEQGLAALKVVELRKDDPAYKIIKELQGYAIYSPITPVLRGIIPETQPRKPVGLAGGQLPDSLRELLMGRMGHPHTARVCKEALGLIDWAKRFGSAPSSQMPLSPAAAASSRVIRFVDRYMAEGRNALSGYDASEGALLVLLLAVLAAHKRSPDFFAVDNADHGLNPRLAKALMKSLSNWIIDNPEPRQIILTTHNPLVLDGLPLRDERVRLFTVSRTNTGRSIIRPVVINEDMLRKAEQGWTLSRMWVMGLLGGVPNV